MPAIMEKGPNKGNTVPRVMILRGPAAVGKTAVARKLSSLLSGAKRAYIAIDELQHFDLRRVSRDKLKLGVYHAAVLCRSFVREGFDVVVDYVFDQDLEFFIEKIFRSHVSKLAPCVVQIFYLDASFEVLERRNKERESPMRGEVLRELYEACDSAKGGYPGETVIQTDKLSVKSTAMRLLAAQKATVDVSLEGLIVPVEHVERE